MAMGVVGCGGDSQGAAKPLAATTTSAAPTPSVQAALGLVDDQESADAGKAIEVKVLGNDSVTLKDGTTGKVETALTAGQFTVSVDTAPTHGSATVDGHTITYTSGPGYGGDDEFTYRVDVAGQSLTGTAVVRITVAKPTPTPRPKPPKPAVSYANCDAVRAMAPIPFTRGSRATGRTSTGTGTGSAASPGAGAAGEAAVPPEGAPGAAPEVAAGVRTTTTAPPYAPRAPRPSMPGNPGTGGISTATVTASAASDIRQNKESNTTAAAGKWTRPPQVYRWGKRRG